MTTEAIDVTVVDPAKPVVVEITETFGPPGPRGPEGPVGPQGVPGLSQTGGVAQPYTFSVSVGTPPATGSVRTNNTNQAAATMLYVHYINDEGIDLKTYFASKLRERDTLNVQDRDDASRWQVYEIAAAYTDSGSYASIPVIWRAGGAASIGNQQKIIVVRESSTMAVRLTVGPTAPLSPVVNDVWMDTTGATVVKTWRGSAWL